MNNCPKCGNPLQEGATSCPICGTNILENKEQAVPAQPVAPAAPAVNPAPAPAQPAANVEQAAAPAPVAPAPVVQQPAAPAPAPAPVAPAPVQAATPTPEAPAAPAATQAVAEAPAAIAPTVERVESPTPVPGIPPSTEQNGGINVEKPLVDNPKLNKPKKKFNPLVIALASIVIIAVIAGITLMPGGKKVNKANNNNTPSSDAVASIEMASNGYNIKLVEGWSVREDGSNVFVNNQEGTVVFQLNHSTLDLEKQNADEIAASAKKKINAQDVEVADIDMSGRKSFLVSANITEKPVQIYYINGGTSLAVGATVIYQSADSKAKYEAAVTEMIGTLSYAIDYQSKAIEEMSDYAEIFNAFNSIVNDLKSPEVPESNPNPEDNPNPENPEDIQNPTE